MLDFARDIHSRDRGLFTNHINELAVHGDHQTLLLRMSILLMSFSLVRDNIIQYHWYVGSHGASMGPSCFPSSANIVVEEERQGISL